MNRLLRREVLEDQNNADRWMISYADFITLLFAFFVVMYAISSVNQEKYRVLSDTLQRAFDTEVASLEPIQLGDPTTAPSPHLIDVPDVRGFADQDPGNTEIIDPLDAASSLLGAFADQEGVSVVSTGDWLEISLQTGLLFEAGSARLNVQAQRLLEPAAELLAATRQPVTIEGYTDNLVSTSALLSIQLGPLRRTQCRRCRSVCCGWYPSRAHDRCRLWRKPSVATNATPDGRARNRRVTIVISRRQDAARNRNSEINLKAPLRTERERPPAIEPRRTASGGLLFSNTPASGADAPAANAADSVPAPDPEDSQ